MGEALRKFEPLYSSVEEVHGEGGECRVRVGVKSGDEVLPGLLDDLISRGLGSRAFL